MAVTKKVNRPALTADYDRAADVLYIAVGEPRPSEAADLDRGIVVRYPFDDPRHAWGVTVVGFRKNNWSQHIEELAKRIAHLLSVSGIEAATVIRRTIGRR
jgi:uncharacterized protein YuzE